MRTIDAVDDVRALCAQWRDQGDDIACVPTMGNLHAGHLSLVAGARARCRRVIATIFVNPTQFAPSEDLARYPRTPDADSARLVEAGCDALFVPSVEQVYPFGPSLATKVEVSGLSDILCGRVRPGHFAGVASVVLRLVNMIEPDVLCLGEKDYQQLLVIHRLIQDLSLRVRVVGLPTVRSESGLALSSRNQYLSEAQANIAATLWRTLQRMRESRLGGENVASIEARAYAHLIAAGFVPDYATIRDAESLGAASEPSAGPEIALIAARLGNTRLIDNLLI